jgi:ribosome-binding factor A
VSERMRRVNEALRHVVADSVEDLGDPSLGLVTVTAVRATPDLRQAAVYFSVLGSARRRARSQAVLERAHGVVQRRVAAELRMKRTPQLTFHYDETLDRALRVNELLEQASSPAGPPAADTDTSDD